MNLLPRSHTEFLSPEYWNQFFKKRGSKAFEWYGEYPQLCGILHKYIKTKDNILVVGCGNSQLSEDMYDVGYNSIVNIDISDVVIRQMTEKNQKKRPQMSFLKMDVTKMTFSDGEFSVVLDKGTLDALMVDSSEQVTALVDHMFQEICRVLKLGGRYICVSLLQDHIWKKVIHYFTELSWPVRIHRIQVENSSQDEKEFCLPVFAVIITKFKKIPGMKQILEVSSCEDKVERLDDTDNLTAVIKEMQYYGIMRQQISQGNVGGDQPSLCLFSDVSSLPRYTLHIVDSPKKFSKKFAIFIVPQGRERDWMFSTEEGRLQLSDTAGFERLVVVSLNRDHAYDDLDSIKAELSGKVMELAPPSLSKQGSQVPFLSVGNDIGKRTIQHRGRSDLSGEYVVEDVEGDDGQVNRCLVFLSNQNIVQSEAKLRTERRKKGKKKKPGDLTVDKSYLSCQHHICMVAGMAFLKHFEDLISRNVLVLLIGLGGGGIPVFLHEHFPKVSVEVVEIDPVIVEVACHWFGFTKDEMLKVHVADGLDFIHKMSGEGRKCHVMMFDVDSKDTTVGLSCPPSIFLEPDFLRETNSVLHEGGVFVLNLACRDKELKQTILDRICLVFGQVFSVEVQDEVNEVIFALKGAVDGTDSAAEGSDHSKTNVLKCVKILNKMIKDKSQTCEVDLCGALDKLNLL